MKKALILQIPEPCDEKWSGMEPTGKGRSCARCERELIDFTTFSDKQLVDYVSKHEGKLCGHFSSRQLNKNLLPVPVAASYSGLTLPALALLAATLTANPVQAQVTTAPTEVALQKDSLKPNTSGELLISGIVTDAATGEALFQAEVILQHEGMAVRTTWTDIDGHFLFSVPEDLVYDTLTVHMEYAYEAARIPLASGITVRSMRVSLRQTEQVLDGMVIMRREPLEIDQSKHRRRRNR